jgi:hypothetical protein
MRSVSIALVVAATLVACSGDGDPTTSESAGVLAPPATGEGVQLAMVSTLPAGTETERCRFYKVPPEGFYINRQDVKYTPGSHHVLLFLTPYQEIPIENRQGQPVDTSGVFECGQGGPTFNWTVNGVVGGAQKANSPAIVDGLPDDTAIVVPGGAVLLMNTHYLNASPRPLQTEARINLYLKPKAQVTREAGIIFFYNPFIHVPGHSRAQARMSCPIRKDITLVNSQSHMHKRGVDYVAYLTDPEGTFIDELYRTQEWEEVVARKYDQPGRPLQAGQRIDYRCGYDNKEDRTVIQGLATTDEMCMFVGLYYPRDPQTEFCALDEKAERRYLGGRWIGSGTTDGPTTADCLTRSMTLETSSNESLYSCVVNSCPALSAPLSESTLCLLRSGEPCDLACQEGQPSCEACLRASCESTLTSLQSTPCN